MIPNRPTLVYLEDYGYIYEQRTDDYGWRRSKMLWFTEREAVNDMMRGKIEWV